MSGVSDATTKHFRAPWADAGGLELLHAPTDALLGVTQTAAGVLEGMNLRTVFDLAASRYFGEALRIAQPGDSSIARHGRVGADAVVADYENHTLDQLADAPLVALSGIGQKLASQVADALAVHTVRELALWPPFHAAREVVSVVLRTPEPDAGGVPADLQPRSGDHPTERVFYHSLVLGEELGAGGGARSISKKHVVDRDLETAGPLDWLDTPTPGFERPAVGARLRFSQSWYTHGVTLGQLLHSVALAPGESTRIAIADWSRRDTGALTSTDEQVEAATSVTDHRRAIGEVVRSVALENQWAETEGTVDASSVQASGSIKGSAPGVEAAASVAGASDHGRTWGHTTAGGSREIGSELSQRVVDGTHQAANAVRNRRASVVREVSQSEAERVSSRVVANYNHMHAMTVQYYEVVQSYRVVTRLEEAERCLFVPMLLADFDDGRVVNRFRQALLRAALSERAARELVADRDFVQVRERNGLAFSPDSVSRAGVDLGWPVGGDPTLSLRAGTLFWVGSASTDVTVDRVEGLTHAGGPRLLHYPDESGNPEYSGDWPTVEHPGVPAGLPLADVGQFSRVRVGLRPPPGKRWAEAGTCSVQLDLWDPQTRKHGFVRLEVPRPAGSYVSVELSVAGGALAHPWLVDHLSANVYHYSQAIWQSLEPPALASLLGGRTIGGVPVNRLVDSTPIGVTGNYLVFRFRDAPDAAWQKWLDQHGVEVGRTEVSEVPLPSGGVFAEAVLGRANSAEKIDLTRFWDWKESPPPLTADSATLTGSRHAETPLTPVQVAPPMVNIVAPGALPDPTGMHAALRAVGQSGSLFDSSAAVAAISHAATASATSAAGATAALKQSATMVGGAANLGKAIDDKAAKSADAKKPEKKEPAETGSGGGSAEEPAPPATPATPEPEAGAATGRESVEYEFANHALGGNGLLGVPGMVAQAVLGATPTAGAPEDDPGWLIFAMLGAPPFGPASHRLVQQLKDRLETGEWLNRFLVIGVVAGLGTSTVEDIVATNSWDFSDVVAAMRAVPVVIRRSMKTDVGLAINLGSKEGEHHMSQAEIRYWQGIERHL